VVELLRAVVQRYPHLHVQQAQQQPVAGKEHKEASGRERKGSPRLEVEGVAKVQLITKLRDLLHDGLLRSSSSTTTSTALTERRGAHDGAAAALVDEEGRGSTGARLSRSLSLKRLTGGKGGSLRKSDEGGRMRMNRSHSLSRDSVVVATSSPTSSSTIWRTDRDRGGEATITPSSDAEHQQRQRRSSSTGSGSGGSRRGSVGRNGDATRSSSISSEDQQQHGLGKENEYHPSGEFDDELEHASSVPGRTLDGADAELAESERRRSGSKREKKTTTTKSSSSSSSKMDKLEKWSGSKKKTTKKTKTTKKKKKDKKDKKERKDNNASIKEKGMTAAEQESREGEEKEREGSTEQSDRKRRGGSELRRSVSWYKEAHNHRLDRIVASTNDKCSAASPPSLTSSSKVRNLEHLPWWR
jgi:hypothetical protein